MPFEARKAALNVLEKLDKGNKTLDGILDDFAQDDEVTARRDRALFNALVYGVLRWRGRLDCAFFQFPFQ
jgi:16S rRNA (cytosine967-C5)-methyltransferase